MQESTRHVCHASVSQERHVWQAVEQVTDDDGDPAHGNDRSALGKPMILRCIAGDWTDPVSTRRIALTVGRPCGISSILTRSGLT